MCARHQHNPLSLLLFLDSQRHSFFEVFFLLRPFWQDSTLRRNSKLSVRPDVIIENCWGHPRSLSVVRMCRRSHNRPTHFLWPSLPPYPLTPSSHLPPPSSQSSESCYDDRSKYEMDGWRRSCGGSCPTLLSAWQEGRCLPVLPGWWRDLSFFTVCPLVVRIRHAGSSVRKKTKGGTHAASALNEVRRSSPVRPPLLRIYRTVTYARAL